VVAFGDESHFWLSDGFHRLFAHVNAGLAEIVADVRPGGLRDAVLRSCSANSMHGLKRTNADKERAVRTVLADDVWRGWNDSEIARHCSVDHKTVARLRAAYLGNSQDTGERKVKRGGTEYTMRTADVGPTKDIDPEVRPGTRRDAILYAPAEEEDSA
jgi:hypothetical protein